MFARTIFLHYYNSETINNYNKKLITKQAKQLCAEVGFRLKKRNKHSMLSNITIR